VCPPARFSKVYLEQAPVGVRVAPNAVRRLAGEAHGRGALELVNFESPPARAGDGAAQANTFGIRHLAFRVGNIGAAVATVLAHGGELVGEVADYEGIYRLCYVRGPEGIIVELAERIG
jgi:catechol 2,3-dioxygenase-like lactoylglutathione lyase family enzyme